MLGFMNSARRSERPHGPQMKSNTHGFENPPLYRDIPGKGNAVFDLRTLDGMQIQEFIVEFEKAYSKIQNERERTRQKVNAAATKIQNALRPLLANDV